MKKYYHRTGKIMDIYKPDDKLTPHFTYGELIRSQTAIRNNINNTPNPEQIQNLISVCKYTLEPIRVHFNKPVFVTSGFRCIELNRIIGSHDTSHHVLGNAVDFVIAGVSVTDVWSWIIKKSGLEFNQCIWEFGNWVHLSYTFDNNRKKCSIAKKIDEKTKYTHYTISQILKGDYHF